MEPEKKTGSSEKSFPDVVVSGTRSTGHLHLGNYVGAVRQFVKIQTEYPCYFFIADYHSLTTHPNPADLHGNIKTVVVEYLACGLDPEKVALFLQSDVPEVTELYLFLNMVAYVGELERVPTFKEKVRKHRDNVNAGLLTYPTLMAADILLHKGTLVPVGKDQEQHLEMARTFAQRFNRLYETQVFPEPAAFNMGGELIKVPGLDGGGKMGKSEGEGNSISLGDAPELIRKKVMKAVSGSAPAAPDEPKSEAVGNLFQLMKIVSQRDTLEKFEADYQAMTIRYGDMKKQLAEDMVNYLAPIRQQILDWEKNEDALRKIIADGAEKARASARQTLSEVRHAIGFRTF